MSNNIVLILILACLEGNKSFQTEVSETPIHLTPPHLICMNILNSPQRTFDIKAVEASSSRPDLVSFADWKVERISRGVFGFSGNCTLNMTILEGDSNEVNTKNKR